MIDVEYKLLNIYIPKKDLHMPLQPAFLSVSTELIHTRVILAHTVQAMAEGLCQPRAKEPGHPSFQGKHTTEISAKNSNIGYML